LLLPMCFFFSSRRRHTRSKRDWSSDVCSSDLSIDGILQIPVIDSVDFSSGGENHFPCLYLPFGSNGTVGLHHTAQTDMCPAGHKIGRASCRERGWLAGGTGRV